MAEYQEENSIKLLLSSSWGENRGSFDSSDAKADALHSDEEFYEEIEAPKFVDFTVPDHYCPDDRYWFCDRVGCDQKHLEEMDSEAIYKKFVRRAMAARSPNVVRLRKILDSSRKCPFSAPAKPSKPRISRMAIISKISEKVNGKEKDVRPLLKPRSTPVVKTRAVSAKYLTTPRIKKSTQGESSFRSVRNPKPNGPEVSNSRMVAKALVFHSPGKKTVKVKTSMELRNPVSKLCKEMKKLEVSSGCKVVRMPQETLHSVAKLGKPIKSKVRVKSSEERCENKEQSSAPKVAEEFGPQKPTYEEEAAQDLDLVLTDDSEGEGSNGLRSQVTKVQETNSNDGKETITDVLDVYDKEDGDNKENVAISDENRMHEKNPKQTERKILAVQDQSGHQVGKKVVPQAGDRKLKEGLISSSPVVKLKKLNATNPKPFRLRTDERGILKERRAEHVVVPRSESLTSSTLSGNLQMKQGNDIQGLKTPKGQERSKPTAAVTPESKKHSDRKPIKAFCESTAMQRLEKFRKISSPLQKHSSRPQSFFPTKNERSSFLIPGQKLDVIPENSPEVLAKRVVKTDEPEGDEAAASRSSSLVRRTASIAAKPNFQSMHVPRRPACTKKPKSALL